jgi:uncharacterized membrane protein YagU involved in acid resistance
MSGTLKAVLIGGLAAGTLDIGAAVAIYHAAPIAVLHAIASGLIGKASFAGGLGTALLGLVLQWAMSLIIAAIYVLAARRLALLTRQWLAMGLAYGVGIWVVMNLVVVPLSAAFPKNPPRLDAGILAMLGFGIVISYCAAKFGDAAGA